MIGDSEETRTDRDRAPGTAVGPPTTGEPAVDQPLADLTGLTGAPLADHHDRLTRAHASLHQALNRDGSDPV